MDEIIFKLKGISAILIAISETDENTVIKDLDMGIKLITDDLLLCIKGLEEQSL